MTRGLYQSKAGTCIHADINGALNILQKSKVVQLDDNLKVKTPILLEVQNVRLLPCAYLSGCVNHPCVLDFVGACSTRRIHLSGGFFYKEELLFRKGGASGKTIVRCQYQPKTYLGVTVRLHEC